MQSTNRSAKYPVDSILKATAILEALSESSDDMGVTELSQALDLGPSTIHRILDTLVSVGYVQRNETTHRYRLGLRIFLIGSKLINQYAMHPEVEWWLKELTRRTGETSKMGILVNGRMVYLSVVESTNSLRFVSKVGEWAPVHCTAMGKVLLAFQPEQDLQRILESLRPLKQMTPHTIKEDEILSHLTSVRQQGYAIDDEEYIVGSKGIAVPVYGEQGNPRAAISISGPSVRLTLDSLHEHLTPLKDIAENLSKVVFV